ncbi:MAG: MinD/ParA family protein [Lachnospiraceae bacterium]
MDQADKLRERVEMLKEQAPTARVIAVTSGKGGVGKTSISVNLALQFREQGKRVVILDADFGLANVEIMLGIRPQYNLADLVFNNMAIEDIITEGPNGIGFISGGSGVQDLVNLDKDKIKKLIAKLVKLDSMYDVVIIDTGAGIAESVIQFVLSSPEVLLVVTPEPTSITDAYSLLKAVNRKKDFIREQKSIKVIANRVTKPQEGQEIFDKISIVVSKFLNIQLEYLGYIPLDERISNAVMEQKPVVISSPDSEPAKRIRKMCEILLNISGEEKTTGIAKVLLNFIKSKKNNR